jgi:hypothetical protein
MTAQEAFDAASKRWLQSLPTEELRRQLPDG